MQVWDRFAPIFAIVDDHSKTIVGVAFFAGDLTDFEHHVAEELLITGFRQGDTGDRFFGDEKEVDRCLGGDVAKAEAEIILVDNVGGNLPGDDFLEEGGLVVHGSRVS